MKTLADNVTAQADDAAAKVSGARSHPARFFASSMMAGLWVGTGVFLMFSAAGPFLAAGSPATKLVSGSVFAIALTFVVFAGAQLATSAMMALPLGAFRRTISWWQATWTLGLILLGNLVGSLLLAWVLIQSGIFGDAATQGMLDGTLTSKLSHGPSEMFFRAVLCNVLICGAIWAASRLKSETAKAIVLLWGVLAFIASGFEHVVANMTIYGLGILGAGTVSVSAAAFATMLLWVGLGNLVGGMVVIGMGYLFISGPHEAREPTPSRERVANTVTTEMSTGETVAAETVATGTVAAETVTAKTSTAETMTPSRLSSQAR